MKFNLNQLAPNISRVFEISRVGNHTVKLIAGRDVKPEDVQLLSHYYSFQESKDGPDDMVVEVYFSTDDIMNLLRTDSRAEVIGDVWERINKVLLDGPDTGEVEAKLDKNHKALLKTAIEKLNLGVCDVMQIMRVAETIARMDFSDKIEIKHLAEAIQYKSYIPDEQ